MILQNIIFPSTENCIEEKMYFRRSEQTRYSFAEDCIYMKKNSSVSFDTYFNSFSATNWFKYTNVENVRLRLHIKGSVIISLFVKQRRSNRIFERCIYEKHFHSETDGDFFDGEFDTTFLNGMYSFTIMALNGGVQILGGYFYTANADTLNNIKLAIVINTSDKKRFVSKNVNNIIEYNQKVGISNCVQFDIVDSQNIIKRNRLRNFSGNIINGDISSSNVKKELDVILDRDMITHVILLDEDVTVLPESIFRCYNFLSLLTSTNNDLIVLGSLLNDELQWQELRNSNNTNNITDLRLLEQCLSNEERKPKEFDAWWCSVIPISYFKVDDLDKLEFNIFANNGSYVENNKKDKKNITGGVIYLNGICVWHDAQDLSSTWETCFHDDRHEKQKRDNSYIKLQNIIFPSVKSCTDEVLYFRRIGQTRYSFADNRVYIGKDGLLNLDTYFNSFSISKWFKYTTVKKVKIKLYIEGNVRVSLIYKEKTLSGIIEKCLYETYFDSNIDGEVFEGEFNSEYNKGMYSVSILGLSEDAELLGGFYYTQEVKTKDIGLTIAICTYKREKYVYSNVKMLEDEFLLNERSELKDRLYINISDNAHSLDASTFRSDHINIFQNKNAGGAGGFTRCMIESKNQEKQYRLTHILLMDDDVILQPESIYRTYKILSLVKDEYSEAFIGGAMLRTDLQWLQTESGAVWNGGKLISHKQGLDLRNLDACLYNEIEEKCEFNAWWYCTIPLSIINEQNLPMPIFIRGDDVEFGLRNMKHLILMNGVCVWHEPFENKYSSSLFYYIFRNRLIDNAVRNIEYSKVEFLEEFREQYFREVFTLRYKNAQLLLDGVKDFLKGPEWLINQDGEKLHQEIMSRCYKLQNVNDLKLAFCYSQYEQMINFVESPREQRKRKITLNGLFGKHYKSVCVPVHDAHIAYFYRAYGAVNYDIANNKAFETYFDKKKEIELIKAYFKLKKEVNKNYNSVKEKYLKAKETLNGIEFWKKYLAIE